MLQSAGLIVILAVAAVGTFGVATRAPRLLGSRSFPAVTAITLLAALGAALASGKPTGTAAIDVALRALLALGVTLAASRAKPWTWLAAAAVASVGSVGIAVGWIAVVALGIASGCALASRWAAVSGRHAGSARRARRALGRAANGGPVVGALLGALTMQALLRLETPHVARATTVIAGAGVLVLVVSGIRGHARRVRRLFYGAVGAAAAFVIVIGGLYGLSALRSRAALRDGVNTITTGLTSTRQGSPEAATENFTSGEQKFVSVHHRLSVWWTRAALVVPVLAQHVHTVDVLTQSGADLAHTAADAARATTKDASNVQTNAIDVDRLARLGAPLQRSVAVMSTTLNHLQQLRSPWLVPAVSREIDKLTARIANVQSGAVAAAKAAQLGPSFLGSKGTRRYFLALTTPSELRGSGGLIGEYALVTADRGHVHLDHLGHISELNPPNPRRHLDGPADYVRRYGTYVTSFLQDATYSPDFPSDAQALEQLLPQSGVGPVDGIISVDPVALAAMLQLTGPLTEPPWPVPLTADNAAQVLLHDAYVQLPEDVRLRFLAGLERDVFTRLTATSFSNVAVVAKALGPALASKHVLMFSTRQDEETLFAQLNMAGAFPPADHDFLAVVNQNVGATKLDWYLKRSVSYDATYDPHTGMTHATVVIRLSNEAPAFGLPAADYQSNPPGAGGPPPIGENATYLNVYTPLGLENVTVDGRRAGAYAEVERERFVYITLVEIPPGATVEIREQLGGRLPAGPYTLDVWRQPTVTADQLHVRVGRPRGWRIRQVHGLARHPGDAAADLSALQDEQFRVSFGRVR